MSVVTTSTRSRIEAVAAEIDASRRRGPLEQIVVPPCPESLARLQIALQGPEPDVLAMAQIAAADVAMSATLIRQANSAVFGAVRPVETVGQALTRLGVNPAARVMTAFLAQGAIRVTSPHLTRFWERSAHRARAMAAIAEQLPGFSPELAHTFGLFADVGMPVLLQSVRGYGSTLVEAGARIDRPFIATENANHRTDHAVVGALVARVWRLAPSLVAALRLSHDFDALADEDTEPEVRSLIAAGLIAEYFVRRHEHLDAHREWAEHGEAALQWLQIAPEDFDVLEERVQVALDAAA